MRLMKKYMNVVTGEVIEIYSWSIGKKRLVENHPEIFMELIEE